MGAVAVAALAIVAVPTAAHAIEVSFTGRDGVTTTARTDGSWSVQLPVPDFDIDPSVPESSEVNIRAVCGGEQDGAVVAVNEPSLAATGPSDAAPTGGLAIGLLRLGAGMLRLGRRPVLGTPSGSRPAGE